MEMRNEVACIVDEAVRYAQAAPLPRPEEALEDLFANP
jgi:hypothetical protein